MQTPTTAWSVETNALHLHRLWGPPLFLSSSRGMRKEAEEDHEYSRRCHFMQLLVDDASTGLFAVHLVAFYADCEHQIVPVHDGHRVSLVYNLLKMAALSAYCLITEWFD